MTQITEQVKAFLDNDFIIRRCLSKGIISLRALSRHMIKELSLKESSMDAVMSAVRRYKKAGKKESGEKLRKLLYKISVKTRSSVADIRLNKSRKNSDSISKLNSTVDIEKGEMIMTIQSEQSITVIIDDKNLEKFNSMFSKSDIISVEKNLVAINLQFTEEAQEVKSIVAVIASSFSAEGINMVEIMSSAPELIIIIKKEDTLKALNLVERMQELG